MNSTTLLIVGLVSLPAVGLMTWSWLAFARVREQLRPFEGFEGMHFDV
jgi:hypothetical protein